jgi:DNA-binding NtrC family response regulator
VSVFLPEAKQPAVPGSPELPDRQEQTGKIGATVLVAEDETRLRRYACRSLAAMGYNVLESGNAAEARRWLEDPRHIDVLFSDIVMPGDMNGTALARWAVRHRPDLKVLLTTGYSEEVRGEREIEATGFPLIEKPYSKDQLRAAINRLFATE